MSAPIVHEIVGGFCRVCGDTGEWLEAHGRDRVVYLDDVLIDTDVSPIGEGGMI